MLFCLALYCHLFLHLFELTYTKRSLLLPNNQKHLLTAKLTLKLFKVNGYIPVKFRLWHRLHQFQFNEHTLLKIST